MEFGEVPVEAAKGAVLAHSLMVGGVKLAKGRVLDAQDTAALQAAGIRAVTVARLGPQDVSEDHAAARLAGALVPDPHHARLAISAPHSGRVNLSAVAAGVVELDRTRIDALNRIDPSLTFATLVPFARVVPGMLVGTVKVIAYGVDRAALDAACRVALGAIRVRPVKVHSAGLILTRTAGAVEGVVAKLAEKGRAATEGRLRALGMTLAEVVTVPHEASAIAKALGRLKGEMALILTGAATSDLHDVAPAAVRLAGGQVARFGMPVDPGNLLFHGDLAGRPVIGLPGCARSPAINGADWVLERLACGITISDDDMAAMGVGGLLKEIPIRPAPREGR
jgi:molybdenum cofactor cytidylyltransferase